MLLIKFLESFIKRMHLTPTLYGILFKKPHQCLNSYERFEHMYCNLVTGVLAMHFVMYHFNPPCIKVQKTRVVKPQALKFEVYQNNDCEYFNTHKSVLV